MSKDSVILVVDDIEINRAMLVRIFDSHYTIIQAENGAKAMEALRQQDISMVLLDLRMPVMDGYEVIQEMKADRKLASIPIVVTTGAADKSERRAFELGADDFITKPYDPYVVRKRVENLIEKYVLQIENLRQALSQAEQMNKAKSTFLSRMSHDLRSPLNSVISMTNLLKDVSDNPGKVIEYSKKINESTQYLLGVINDILNVSAIENQKVEIACAPFDFRKQVEGIAAMFYGQCKEKKLHFELNLADCTEEFLFGDPIHMKEILVNLVSNAVKFTPEGGRVIVRVSQTSRVADMVKLRFEVIDNGEGIAEDRQKDIFKPYVQENNDTAHLHGGSGLGLSIVKNIAELMGGQVNVQSVKGEGSTFIVELPFTVAKELPVVTTEHLKNIRALMIDDDKETQDYGKKIMNKIGVACDVAETGKKALAMMREAYEQSQGYDICFVDWRMPGMSGVEITKQIRDDFDDDTVIVVASAYNLSEIAQEAKMAGANVVVPKPMFQSTVFDLLMDMTGGGYRRDAVDTKYCFAGRRILLAEDNMLNAEVAEELLRVVGFEVDRARDGREACNKFENSPEGKYDAILMDVQMPVMNGHEATRHIRSSGHPQASSIPIIAVTANAFTDDVRASLAAGMNDHIAKPIDTEHLYAVLDGLVGQTQNSGQAENC